MSNKLNELDKQQQQQPNNITKEPTTTTSNRPNENDSSSSASLFPNVGAKTVALTNQPLTIQDAFDPEDSGTVHFTQSNTSFWLGSVENQPQKTMKNKKSSRINNNAASTGTRKHTSSGDSSFSTPTTASTASNPLSFNKLLPLNKLTTSNGGGGADTNRNFLASSKLFKANNFNFFSNNFLNLNLKSRPLQANTLQASLNKNTNSNSSYIDLNPNNGKNIKNSIVKYKNNLINDQKYGEYKKKWNELLRREKKIFESKWSASPAATSTAAGGGKLEDYELKKTLGNGSFGRVILVKHKETHKFYALKVLIKRNVVKSKQVEHTINEKKITSCVSCPFIASFMSSFKDNSNLYIVLEYVPGGEMFKHLVKQNKFTENQSRFYCGQVILAIEYLHSLDIIHRDLKPENTLIGHDGYVKISDFGFAKYVKTRTYTLCGTPEYLAPEIIQSKPYGKAVDWWAIGILTYEMSVGKPPFQSDQPMKIYEKILSGKYKVPGHLSEDVKDFMRCLIQADVTKRYGNLKNGVDDVKTHKWFANMDWMALYNKKLNAPMIPKIKHPGDTSNFDSYDEESITISREMLFEKEFADF